MDQLKATLTKKGKTLEDWLEEKRIENEVIRRRVWKKAGNIEIYVNPPDATFVQTSIDTIRQDEYNE